MAATRTDEVVGTRSVTGPLGDGFEVGYVTDDGTERRALLNDAWSVPFERCRPVRRFPSHKGQKHHSGRWWSATMGGHVGFESWLERDHLILLDFDPAVIAVSSQPFWLFWAAEHGNVRSHAPDYFARLRDGSALVVDCRPAERIKPKDAATFEVTHAACELVGWHYRLVGATDTILAVKVRRLAGYRHPRHCLAPAADALRAAFAAPAPLIGGAEAVGDPIAVLPVLFHLLWPRDQPHPPPPPSGQLHPGGQPFLIWHARWVATAGAWLIVSS